MRGFVERFFDFRFVRFGRTVGMIVFLAYFRYLEAAENNLGARFYRFFKIEDEFRVRIHLENQYVVVNTTAKVTGKVLTAEDQGRLAEETNRQLAAN